MKKVLFFMLVVMVVASLSGCLGGAPEKTETKIKTDEGTIEMKTETSDGKETTTFETKVETEEGEQTVKITGTAGEKADEWCPEGGDWSLQGTGAGGEVTATWKVDKLITNGKYAGLCHVIYTAKNPEGEIKADYWFDESGERGFYEMNLNGQKITQELRG
jgi:major membrane immunogen (membrane-anchored lipoprotein)